MDAEKSQTNLRNSALRSLRTIRAQFERAQSTVNSSSLSDAHVLNGVWSPRFAELAMLSVYSRCYTLSQDRFVHLSRRQYGTHVTVRCTDQAPPIGGLTFAIFTAPRICIMRYMLVTF